MFLKILSFIISFYFFSCLSIFCDNFDLLVSLGSYGIKTGLKAKDRYYFEVGLWYEKEISVFSIRPAIEFYENKKVKIFGGIDYANITFFTNEVFARGFWLMPLVFGEYFISKKSFFRLDLGIPFVCLFSQDKTVFGPEFLVAFALGTKIF
ncbi:MAG: hypothetical protein RMJ67_07975 [Elusimicrobiota bacterium]|nr:hypothetical protein [Endomicrobiia bacterium]MDW8166431.1 hypothetical protein [Elusimicrobiota bacterium]